jgi:6-phosphogluconolactonase
MADAAAGTAVDAHPGLRDEDLSADGRFLYAIDARTLIASSGVSSESMDSLTSVGSRNGLRESVAGRAAN